MNAGTSIVSLDGPHGAIDVAVDRPAGQPLGAAIVAHPHPLHGGTRDNKVVQTLARALVQSGTFAGAPTFAVSAARRALTTSGIGEADDLAWLAGRLHADPHSAGRPTCR